MSFTIDFDSLMNGYIALMLQCNGVEVELRVPEKSAWLDGGLRLCGFFDAGVFASRDSHMEGYGSIEKAFETLNAMSPNTIYMERAFAVQDRNGVRDFVNHFRSKAFRDVFDPEDDRSLRMAGGCALMDGKVVKRAPAYRFNAGRHVISLLKTIKSRGGKIVMGGCADVHAGDPLAIYAIPNGKSPVPMDTVFLPGGVWLFNRCGDSYLTAMDGIDAVQAVRYAFPGCALERGDLAELSVIKYEVYNDSPLNAWAKACRFIDTHGRELGICKPVDMSAVRFWGSDFEFQLSAPDVLGYADSRFDWVKRMDINVDLFRNAVYDYGTCIEDIVNTTYDLYPEYHNGPKAFDEAIRRWREGEIDF